MLAGSVILPWTAASDHRQTGGGLSATGDPRNAPVWLPLFVSGDLFHCNAASAEISLAVRRPETDVDHNITRSYGYDPIGRPTLISESGGGITRNKKITYYDSTRQRLELTDLNSTGDQAVGIWTQYDQLGRESLNKDSYGDYQVETLYYTPPSSGLSYKAVSNPYLTGSETTAGWTVTSYDTSGRISGLQHIAGSALPEPWGSNGNSTGTASSCYAANSTTATDEAGVSRTSYVDGLGRLTSVTENGLTLAAGAPPPSAMRDRLG